MQWPHCLHPLTQPRPPPQLAHGRITPPSLWEPAGPAKRDLLRPQVLPSSPCRPHRLHIHSNFQDINSYKELARGSYISLHCP